MNAHSSILAVKEAVEQLEVERIRDLVRRCLDQDIGPMEIIRQAIAPGLAAVGEKFEAAEYFLGELILAGHTATEAMDLLEAELPRCENGNTQTVVLATVKGDMHEIGKDIVAMLLKANGFHVIDLGVDVPADTILQTVKENNAGLLGLSLLLSSMVENLKEVIDAFDRAGLRDKVKIVIGGACTSESLRAELGADAYADDAVHGIDIFKQWAAPTY
jgi:5-methyltetrahydrofolate--homocysteine methyltransferase